MKRILLSLSMLVALHQAEAQFATPVVDGVINPGEYGNHTAGQNGSVDVDGRHYYITWDDTRLYVATDNDPNGDDALNLYIDVDPLSIVSGGTNANGTLTGTNYDNVTPTLPFRADAFVFVKNGYKDFILDDNNGGWGFNHGNTELIASNYNGSTSVLEFSIPWSALTGGGRPASFNFLGYLSYSGGGGGNFARIPSENPGGNTPVMRYYETVSSTQDTKSTKPFSQKSYSQTSGAVSDFPANDLWDVTLNSTSMLTVTTQLNIYNTLNVVNGSSLSNNNGTLVLKSTPDNTARITPINGVLNGNITVERYVTAKAARKNIFLASPVSQVLSESWQQKVHITGPGTGGAPCNPSDPANPSQPTQNSNGFDATQTNNPSFFTYNGANAAGSRWTTIPATSIVLTPGEGYRAIVRGDRSQGCALLIDQATAANAVTLSATGALTTGVNRGTVARNVINGFTFLGNPYPSEISFTDFNNANSSIITNKYWSYNPESNAGIYSIYEIGNPSGTVNFPAGYDANVIASGQSFFVQSTTGGTVNFDEAHKSFQRQVGMFRGAAYTNFIRTELRSAANQHIDEVVVRFGEDGTGTYEPTVDAISMNEGSEYITTLKGNTKLAIQTRAAAFVADTVALNVAAAATGSFKLNFSDYQNFVTADIVLLDRFTNTTQNVKANPSYNFDITADAASKGDKRFALVFKPISTLPVDFINISSVRKTTGVEVNWKLPNEENIKSYVVERAGNNRVFVALGNLAARGSRASAVNYNYLDQQPEKGTAYYRIKATLTTGEFKYSPIIKVNSGSNGSSLSFYPNPVKDVLNLVLSNEIKGNYSILIIDAKGLQVITQNNLNAANNVLKINTATLAKGMYMLEIIGADGTKETARFVK